MDLSSGDPQFKAENRRSWSRNTEYWLNNPLRHVEDTRDFFAAKLRSLLKPNYSIVDMGCGNGWVLDLLLEFGAPFSYQGLDFTEQFITHLRAKYRDVENARFEEVDLEVELPDRFEGIADIVVNAFHFFEMTALDVVFSNAVKMLKPNGKLVMMTIDSTYLALAVSKDMQAFKTILAQYEEFKYRGAVPHFFQNIDLGDAESPDLTYASVLYSLDDFYGQAKKHGMRLADYGEVVKTSKFLPKVYQYVVFEK